EKSLAFYCGELGLEPDRADEWRRGEVLFPSARVNAATLIDLFPIGDGPPRALVPNMDHFCLVIQPTDLDALAARFPGARRAAVDAPHRAAGHRERQRELHPPRGCAARVG